MKTKIVVILSCIILFNQTMFGWGREGHIIVGEIAYRYLSETAKIHLKKYLKDQSLAVVANWMDAIKKKQPETAGFHFINSDNLNPPNLQTELLRVISDLKEYGIKKDSEINIDIKYAVHLTGDLHQPLHCGYAYDKGGNKVSVVFNDELDPVLTICQGIAAYKK